MSSADTLQAVLCAICDISPLSREPSLSFQVSVIGPRAAILWDASPDADEGIACAVASQFGAVVASAASPIVGVLIEAEDAEQAARMLRPAYGAAISPPNPENPF